MSFPSGKTAAVGVATYGMGSYPGQDALDLAIRASLLALEDAGLKPSDVDGLFTTLSQDPFSPLTIAEYFGIHPKVTDNARTGGSSFQIQALWAALALEAGLCDVALIAYGSNQRSATGALINTFLPNTYEHRYKPMNPPSSYALVAARHMHEYGTTRRHLAEVAVAARKWAQLNPEAFMRDDLSIEEVLAARMVSDPLSVRDCCLVTDGAAALVMVRTDRAKDLRQKPAYLLGAASAVWHRSIANMPDLCVSAARESGARAYAQAGIGPADINVAQLYDAFTINTILFLEDLGFCPKGEGGRFVEDGGIAPGGRLPVNTNGGGLSCVHPGLNGLFTMVEAVHQVRGTADKRQVPGAAFAIAHGNGGMLSSQATAIFGAQLTR